MSKPPALDSVTAPVDFNALSTANMNVVQWVNDSLRAITTQPQPNESPSAAVTLDAAIGSLLSRLQLFHQESTASLEDIITQSIVRLPRATLEVERMAAETMSLSENIQRAQARHEPIIHAVPETSAAAVARLRNTKEKLTRCANLLQRSRLLKLQVEQLEMASTQRGEGFDIEAAATSLSEAHSTLRDVQAIDPTFGTQLEQRIRTLEAKLEHGVENEFFELLVKHDRSRVQMLYATLRKVGRTSHAMRQYMNHVVSSRRTQLLADLRTAQIVEWKDNKLRSLIPPNRSLADTEAAITKVLSQHYRLLEKLVMEEMEYYTFLVGDATQEETCRELIDAVRQSTDDVLLHCVKHLESSEGRLRCLTACYGALLSGSNSTTATHDKRNEEDSSRLRPCVTSIFTHLVDPFVQCEKQFLQKEASNFDKLSFATLTNSAADAFQHYLEQVKASLTRTGRFCSLLQVADANNHGTWQERMANTVTVLLQGSLLSIREALSPKRQSSSSSAAPHLQGSDYQQRVHDALQLVHLAFGVKEHMQHFFDAWPVSIPGYHASFVATVSEPVMATAHALTEHGIATVCSLLAGPFLAVSATYPAMPVWQHAQHDAGLPKTLVAYNPGQVAPSDLVRQLGECLMELPLTLDALGAAVGDEAEERGAPSGGEWLTRTVQQAVSEFLSVHVCKVVLKAGPGLAHAVDQLTNDLEYLENVLAAVSDQPFESLGALKQKLKDHTDDTKDVSVAALLG